MRTVEEWKGKTDDSMPPPHVRLRIFEREGGRCHISGRKIGPADKWDLDHKIAICNGGENVESNLFPALRDKHREKTKADRAEKANVDRKRSKHLGIKPPSRFRRPEGMKYNWSRGGRLERIEE